MDGWQSPCEDCECECPRDWCVCERSTSTGQATKGHTTRIHQVTPSRDLSTRSGTQPATPSRGGATQGLSTPSGGQPAAPSRGGATHGPNTQIPVGITTRSRALAKGTGGVKRGPPRGPGSPTKRGPASPSPSRGITPSTGPPDTPSKGVTQGLAKCTIGPKDMPFRGAVVKGQSTHSDGQLVRQSTGVSRVLSTRSGGQPVMPSTGGITRGQSTCSVSQPITPSRHSAQPGTPCKPSSLGNETCKGCTWSGKSLRGHLVRTMSNCQDFYDMAALEEEARKVKIQQRAMWEADHRSERSERMMQQRHSSQEDSHKKRAASRFLSKGSKSQDPQEKINEKSEAKKTKRFVCNLCDKQ